MTLNECIEGYRLLGSAFVRNMSSKVVENIYNNFFTDKKAKQFIQACKNISTNHEKFPSVAIVLREMRNITIDTPESEKILGCGSCVDGMIFYTRDGFSYMAKCDCEAGRECKLSIPNYKDLLFPKDSEIVREKGRGKVSDKQCQEAKNKLWLLLEREDLIKPLPPSDTYDNSEFTKGEIESSKSEAKALFDTLGGESDFLKEKERERNIRDKEDKLPF